jgi:hypothetical protein
LGRPMLLVCSRRNQLVYCNTFLWNK